MSRYARTPTTFAELVEPFAPHIQETAAELRARIQSVIPDAHEAIYGGLKMANVLYGLGNRSNVVCGIQPAESHCKLYLHHVKPGDVPGARIEGSGKNVRHLKVLDAAHARSAEVTAVLELAHGGAASRLR